MSAWGATIDARMVGWANSVHRHSPSRPQTRHPPFSLGANTPSSAHPFPHEQQPRRSPTGQKTRVLVLVQDTLEPAVARVQGKGRVGRGRRGREGRSTRQAGVVGGVQGHRARRTSKQDMFCTSSGTCSHTLMRFAEGTESSAHSFHANWTGAPSSSRAYACERAAFCTGTVLDWTQIRLYRYSHFVLSDRLLLAVTRNLGVTYGGHVVEGPSYGTTSPP